MIVPVGAVVVLLCLSSAVAGIVFFMAEFQEPDQALPWGNKPARLWA